MKARPCDACRRRKARCVRRGPGPCDFCARIGIECTRQNSTSAPMVPGVPWIPQAPEMEEPPRKEDLGKSTVPSNYDFGCWVGPSSADDPQLVKHYERNEEGLASFVTQGTQFVSDTGDDCFAVYRETCQCDPDFRNLRALKINRLREAVDPFREKLLALYFQFVDWTWPAVDKKRFYQAYYIGEPPLNRGLLSGMLALSCMYWKYNPDLVVQPMPPGLDVSLWQACLREIEHDISCGGATLDTAQAMLIYLQKRRAGDDLAEIVHGRMLVGKLVAIAYILGLHRDCSNWNISDHEKLTRSRIRALVFYVDRWSAATLGHPPMFTPTLGSKEWHFTSPFPQEQSFVEVIKVTKILDDVLQSYPWSTRAEADQYLEKLTTWRNHLDPDLADLFHRNAAHYCNNGTLHLSAMAVEALIRRHMVWAKLPGTRQRRAAARDLVQRIVAFTNEISHMHRHAFWLAPCTAQLNMLAHMVLLYHARSSDQERRENMPRMRQWMQSLRILATVWPEGAGLAFLRMDAVFHNAHQSFSMDSVPDSESEPEDDTSDVVYDSNLEPLEPLEPMEPLDFTTIDTENSDQLVLENSLHEILAQYLNEGLT